MATVKIRFHASSVGMKEGTLVYQVIHRRVTRQVATGYRLYPPEWDTLHSELVIPPDIDEYRRGYLAALRDRVTEDTATLKDIIARFDHADRHYTADDVVEHYRSPLENGRFMDFTRSLIAELKRTGRERTAERYTTVRNSFMRFMADRGDIPFGRVDSALMVEYESYLKADGVCPNSSSFYFLYAGPAGHL